METGIDNKRILMIGDREGYESIADALKKEGFICERVAHGKNAIESLKKSDFDSVFIELMQPPISETDLLKEMRTYHPQFICLLLSESPIKDDIYSYLLKPPYTNDLLITLESALEKQKLIWENMRMIRELKEANEELLRLHSEAKSAKEELERTQDKLIQSEKLASMGQLAASIAHEVNHPITVIIIYARLMLNKLHTLSPPPELEQEWRRYLNITYNEMTRCGNIVKELLEFSRHSKPNVQLTNLEALLDRPLRLLEHKASIQGVRIHRRMHCRGETMVNPEQIEQAFLALIVNALQSMPEGGALTVTLANDSTLSMPDHIRIDFADTGCGIAQEDLKRIFDPFFTTREEGVGLGLSVVYGIITRHEGEISAESKVGEGTTFTIRLPKKI
ncbi:MAG: ATP-binding protein [bacterium]